VLRRVARPDKSTGPDFVRGRARAIRQGARNDLRALLRLDPESSDSVTGMPLTPCYSIAIVVGEVKRTALLGQQRSPLDSGGIQIGHVT